MGRRRTGEMPRVVVVKPHGHAGVRIGGKAYWLGKCPDGKPTPAPDGGAVLCGRLGYASATAQGWSVRRAATALKTGVDAGVDTWVQVRALREKTLLFLGLMSAVGSRVWTNAPGRNYDVTKPLPENIAAEDS